ncbi:MAG: transporter substrate-binding domain-containing protein, partial [Desulfobacteria bacterium]
MLWMTPLGCVSDVRRIPAVSRRRLLVLSFVCLLCLAACSKNRALERIQESGTITVITRNNAHCYYTYRDQDMGFEYDLAKAFADFLGVELKVNVSESWDQLLPSLDKGDGEFVAASLTITPSRSESAGFSRE